MKKLTKIKLAEYLDKRPIKLDEYQIKEIFNILGFNLKEYIKNEDIINFEIHYRTTYIIKYQGNSINNSASFTNEYINFGESIEGINHEINTLKDLIVVNFNLFMPGMDIGYNGILYDPNSYTYTESEMKEFVDYFNDILLK